jgi:hypothetical protein
LTVPKNPTRLQLIIMSVQSLGIGASCALNPCSEDVLAKAVVIAELERRATPLCIALRFYRGAALRFATFGAVRLRCSLSAFSQFMTATAK